MKHQLCVALLLISSSAFALSPSLGEKLYTNRCAMCHGNDARATGALAQKSDPSTPDLTSCVYQKQLAQFPGRIVASIVLMPGGSLIPDTLKANGVNLPKHVWTDAELRAIHQYVLALIEQQPLCVNPKRFTWRI